MCKNSDERRTNSRKNVLRSESSTGKREAELLPNQGVIIAEVKRSYILPNRPA